MNDKGGEALLAGIGGLVVIIGATLLNGVVVSDFWEWFVMPVFTQMPPLSTGQTIGFAFIISYMAKYTPIGTKVDEDEPGFFVKMFSALAYVLICWGFGAIIHMFIS
jgi:hypothetical protein